MARYGRSFPGIHVSHFPAWNARGAFVTSAEAAAGGEATSLTTTQVASETGAGTEAQTQTAVVSTTDAAAGGEAQTLATSLATTETGAGTEATVQTASLTATDIGSGIETVTMVFDYRTSYAYAEGFMNVGLVPAFQTQVLAYAYRNVSAVLIPVTAQTTHYVYEFATNQSPTPHIWYVTPTAANIGDSVAVVGFGFGNSMATWLGAAVLIERILAPTSWAGVPPGTDALTSNRSIQPTLDTATPEHQRIVFVVPPDAQTGNIKVVLSNV